ncbi:MAG: type II toxin-antitoxin system VapC family toxin [Chloroflexota bacterium]
MRLLLDTHVLLWALAEPHRLSEDAADLIRTSSNEVLVSAASAWEIATKYRLGKLPGAGPIVGGFAAHLAVLRAEELPVRSTHALRAGSLVVEHRDPFDRMLAAQAIVEGVRLVTQDSVFSAVFKLETLW